MLEWKLLHPHATMEMLGEIPYWITESNPKTAKEQLDDGYRFGGFRPFEGFKLTASNGLAYPGDPVQMPIASCKLRNELITVYPSAWVAVIQPDRSFEVCRMD